MFETIPVGSVLMLGATVIILALTWLHLARIRAGSIPPRRDLPALRQVRTSLGIGAESGKPIYIALGSGSINSRNSAAETISALTIAEHVAHQATLNSSPLQVGCGDAVAWLAARGVVRQAYRTAGQMHEYDGNRIQLLGHQDPSAFAIGTGFDSARQPIESLQTFGDYGQEYLLVGEPSAQRDLPLVAGATNATALAAMHLLTPSVLVGEELFAADAYLSDNVTKTARLMTHDALRIVIIVLLIGLVIYNILQGPLGWPNLFHV